MHCTGSTGKPNNPDWNSVLDLRAVVIHLLPLNEGTVIGKNRRQLEELQYVTDQGYVRVKMCPKVGHFGFCNRG